MTLLWAVAATLLAIAALALLVRAEWRAPVRRVVPILATKLQTVQSYAVLASPPGRILMLDLVRDVLFRDHLTKDPQETAARLGEARLVLRLLRLTAPDVRAQIAETLIHEEIRHA